MYNLLIYGIIFAVVVWSVESLNINHLFKKNRPYQARIFYIILILSLTYLTSSFIIDFLNILK